MQDCRCMWAQESVCVYSHSYLLWSSVCTDIKLEQLFFYFLSVCLHAVYAKLACIILCENIHVFSPARLWHRGIHHASLFVLRGWAPTDQSPAPLLPNLGTIATLPTGAFNWSEDIKERLWQHSRKVKGLELWAADRNAEGVESDPRLSSWYLTLANYH